jgi:hypothetical protein
MHMREARWLLLRDPKELEGQIRKQITIQESMGTKGEGGQEQRRGPGKGIKEVGREEVEVESGSGRWKWKVEVMVGMGSSDVAG